MEVPALYTNKQFSQEFNLTYTGPKIQGVAGVYYIDANAYNEVRHHPGRRPRHLDLYQRQHRHQGLGRLRRRQLQPHRRLQRDGGRPLYRGRAPRRNLQANLPWPEQLAEPGQPGRGPVRAPNTDLGKDGLHRTDKKFTPSLGFGYKLRPEHNVYAHLVEGLQGRHVRPRMDLTASGGPHHAGSLAKRRASSRKKSAASNWA
jgi:iron complex outermembrane receptor protein